MDTPQEFSARARRLFEEAQLLEKLTPDCELSHWLNVAKRKGMTWTEGLEFAISGMQRPG